MNQQNKNIDNVLKDKLLQAEVSPPDSVWNSIESTLIATQKRAALLLYRRLAYAAAAILIFGFFAFYLSRSDSKLDPQNNKLANQTTIDSLPGANDSLSIKNSEIKRKNIIQSKDLRNSLAKNSIQKGENSVREMLSHVAANQYGEIISRTIIIPVSIRESERILEVFSLYTLKSNPLNLLKAGAYKHRLKYEELENLLADHSSGSLLNGWSVGLAFAPASVERSNGIFTPNAEALYNNAGSPMTYVSEKDMPAYSGGINLAYQISERWSFKTGMYYLKQGQRIENFSVLQNSANAINSSNSYYGNIIFENYQVLSDNAQIADVVQLTDVVSFSSFNADLMQQFGLLEIPFIVDYKIVNRKTVLSVLAGINSGIVVSNQVYLANNSTELIGKTESINSVIYKSVFGLNFEYPLSRKLYINLSPNIKFQLNNFNKNAIVGEQLKYLEFKTGLNYRF